MERILIFYYAKNIFTSNSGGEYIVSKKLFVLTLAALLVFATVFSISVLGNSEQSVVSAFSKNEYSHSKVLSF